MSNSTNSNPPGLMLPTQKSYTPGSGNPRDSAALSIQNSSAKQANLNSIGGRRRKFIGGAVSVPQYSMPYPPQGGQGTNPNDQIKSNSSTSMQSRAWAVNDSQATNIQPPPPVGGSKRKPRICNGGGSSKFSWGCYSGGRKKTRRISRKKNRKRSKRNYRR
jgi:hypothetical protein